MKLKLKDTSATLKYLSVTVFAWLPFYGFIYDALMCFRRSATVGLFLEGFIDKTNTSK